ncbi:MAG: phosphoribosylglycinamide synthetase C domain-containing protein, partial [Pseudomonadota bacterium]
LLLACAMGNLDSQTPAWSDDFALTVVMAAKGYPGAYAKGEAIRGLDEAAAMPGVRIFHAGTAAGPDGPISAGGRVLAVTALGADLSEARDRAYAAVDLIDWPGGFHRRDIGWRALGR